MAPDLLTPSLIVKSLGSEDSISEIKSCPDCTASHPEDLNVLNTRPLKTAQNQVNDPIIGRLPVEITSIIFNLSIHVDAMAITKDDYWHPSLQHQPDTFSPLTLGAVCRYWRTVAFSTPILWSSVSINLSSEEPLISLNLLEEWLERSQSHSLHIRFHVDHRITEMSSPLISKLILLINTHTSRWQTPNVDIPSTYLDLLRCDATPPLSTLRIATHPEGNALNIATLDLGVVPSPRRLALKSTVMKELRIDFSNLIHFSAFHFEIAGLLEVLNSAPKIEICDIDGPLISIRGESLPPSTTSLSLRKLLISEPPPSVWGLLSVPFLRSLVVAHIGHNNWAGFIPFVQQCSHTLRKLEIRTYWYAHEPIKLIDILFFLNNLEELYIKGGTLVHTFFQHMHDTADTETTTAQSLHSPFLPRLRFFEYRVPADFDFQWKWVPLLFPATKLRQSGFRPLKRVVIQAPYTPSETSLSKYSLLLLLDAMSYGVEFCLSNVNKQDVVESAKEYYGLL